MSKLNLDVETRSVVDLTKVGAYRYFEHPETDVLCACWSVDDGPVQLWKKGDPAPELPEDFWLSAFNAQFELLAWRCVLEPKYGWPKLDERKVFCTQAKCLAMGLPAFLDGAARALRLSVEKDQKGRTIMLKYCKPRRMVSGEPVWWDNPDELEQLYRYCAKDVIVERMVEENTRRLS